MGLQDMLERLLGGDTREQQRRIQVASRERVKKRRDDERRREREKEERNEAWEGGFNLGDFHSSNGNPDEDSE